MTLKIDFIPEIDPNLVASATVASAAFGAVSALNSFRQVAEMKAINAKLDTVIRLQKETLQAIKDLGVKFEVELERAFIRDVNLELRAHHQSFSDLVGVLRDEDGELRFPSEGPDYRGRLEFLMWQTQDLTNKLAGYGEATFSGVIASTILLDTMFKLAGVDKAYRVSFLEGKKAIFGEYYAFFSDHHEKALRLNENHLRAHTYNEHIYAQSGPPQLGYPYCVATGNPRDGYTYYCTVQSSHHRAEPQPARRGSRHTEPLIKLEKIYNKGQSTIVSLKSGILNFIKDAQTNTNNLIALYTS